MHRNASRIKALIDCSKTPWTTDDQPYLESLSDERLAALEAHRAALIAPVAATATEPVQAAAATSETKTPQTADEFLAIAPQEIKDLVAQARAAETKKRDAAMATLRAAGVFGKDGSPWTEDELKKQSTDMLEKIAAVAGAKTTSTDGVDFSLRGTPRAASAADDEKAPPPAPDLGDKIRELRTGKKPSAA